MSNLYTLFLFIRLAAPLLLFTQKPRTLASSNQWPMCGPRPVNTASYLITTLEENIIACYVNTPVLVHSTLSAAQTSMILPDPPMPRPSSAHPYRIKNKGLLQFFLKFSNNPLLPLVLTSFSQRRHRLKYPNCDDIVM